MALQVRRNGDVGPDTHVPRRHPGVDQPIDRILALVQNLDVFLREGDIDLEELHLELEVLLNLALGDVEFLTLQVGTTDQAVIEKGFVDAITTGVIFTDVLAKVCGKGIALEDVVYQFHVLADVALGRSV